MRFLLLALALAASASPAAAQSRYTTTSDAVFCLTERGIDDGLALIAQGQSKILDTVGCVRPAAMSEIFPLSNGSRGPHVVRAVVKANGQSITGYLFTMHIYDGQKRDRVGPSGWISY